MAGRERSWRAISYNKLEDKIYKIYIWKNIGPWIHVVWNVNGKKTKVIYNDYEDFCKTWLIEPELPEIAVWW